MPDLQDQLKLEDDLMLHGLERYESTVNQAEEQGRTSDTSYGQRLLRGLVGPVADSLEEFKKSGAKKNGKYRKLIKDLDSMTLAYIAVKTILDGLHHQHTVTNVAMNIGLRVEDERRFAAFKEMNPGYYSALVKDFQRKNTKAYRHMRNVLAVMSKKKGFKWDNWAEEYRLNVGSLLLDRVLECTDLIYLDKKKHKKGFIYRVCPTQEAVTWIESYNEYAGLLHPYTKPCVIPPDDWSGLRNGGYWSEAMRHRVPFIIGMSGFEEKFISDHNIDEVYEAVNSIQKTAWSVNTRVLDVLQEVWDKGLDAGLPKKEPCAIPKFRVDTPPKEMDEDTFKEFCAWKAEVSQMYTDEASRASKAYEVSRIIKMAATYKEYDSIYFVYQCDFRGRVYASSSGLSPQGSDYNKGLLQFSTAKPLGEDGHFWLAVHGANCYGVDKVSFEERVTWVEENGQYILDVADDPIGNTSFWSAADKPFQFLAFCFEFADSLEDPVNYESRLPIGMDGSCNGLQNFSALLRDEVGGAATNLTPTDSPSDIYREVADRALEILLEMPDSPEKRAWCSFATRHEGIPRSIAKRPVMTLPYGSTRYSCFGFVSDAVREIDPDFFVDLNGQSAYFTDILWQAIEDVVIAARAAMDWLQEVADMTAKRNLPVWWINPVGFPVFQANKKVQQKRVRSLLLGNMFLSLNKDTNVISPKKQMQGIAPNFVHSLDSAHMMLVVNRARQEGMDSFAMIHDDFGVHACDVPVFRDIIRDEFVSMYAQNEPLHELYTSCTLSMEDGVLPPVPDYGSLDIQEVRKSEYFFA